MGAKGGPHIVDEGLIFYVDASNRKSWFGPDLDKVNDLKSIIIGSISNDTSGSYGSNKSFAFDGVDDNINFGDHNSINNVVLGDNPIFTWELWIKPNSDSTYGGIGTTSSTSHIAFYNYTTGNVFNFNKVNSDSPGGSRTYQLQTIIPQGSWVNYILCYDGSGGTPTITTFVNGEGGSNTLTVNDSTSKIGASGDNSLLIGELLTSDGARYNGESSIIKIYNRILTAQEVKQNYNALKNRFI
jgi:hypothetical protein